MPLRKLKKKYIISLNNKEDFISKIKRLKKIITIKLKV